MFQLNDLHENPTEIWKLLGGVPNISLIVHVQLSQILWEL
jgi:hypothetical protein